MAIKILIINPNTTATMTAEIEAVAKAYARPDTQITAVNPTEGPASIQGPEDGAACLPYLFALFDHETTKTTYDAVIIACFDDTGLQALKAKSAIPVLGIGEAAFHKAAMLGQTFSTVTTLSVSVPIIAENITNYGFSHRSIKVRASEIPVLNIGKKTENRLRDEVKRAIDSDKCDSVVLGCAGMAKLAQSMSNDFGVPVIDGIVAAVGFCEALVRRQAA